MPAVQDAPENGCLVWYNFFKKYITVYYSAVQCHKLSRLRVPAILALGRHLLQLRTNRSLNGLLLDQYMTINCLWSHWKMLSIIRRERYGKCVNILCGLAFWYTRRLTNTDTQLNLIIPSYALSQTRCWPTPAVLTHSVDQRWWRHQLWRHSRHQQGPRWLSVTLTGRQLPPQATIILDQTFHRVLTSHRLLQRSATSPVSCPWNPLTLQVVDVMWWRHQLVSWNSRRQRWRWTSTVRP